MIEKNGWKLVSPSDSWEDVYEKRVQEGKDNDMYIVRIHVSKEKPHVGKVLRVWVLKEYWVEGKECKDIVALFNHRSNHENVYVHTFQNLLNIAGLKETSETFNIMQLHKRYTVYGIFATSNAVFLNCELR